MNSITNESASQDCSTLGEGVAMSGEETRQVVGKLQAQTVLVGKWISREEARDPEKMLGSLRGTGILVRNGNTPGILTAGHVVGDMGSDIRQPPVETSEIVMAIDQSEIPMAMGLQRRCRMRVQGWLVRGEGMRNHLEVSPRSRMLEAQLRGPDIAWIRITEEDARTLEGYGGVFHNWKKSGKTRDEKMRKQGRQEAGLWVCGQIHEKSRKFLAEKKRQLLCGIVRQVFREGSAPEQVAGWDRFDYTMELDSRSETGNSDWGNAGWHPAVKEILHKDPASWGGMSGAGIWEVCKKRVDGPLQCSLVGVVYAEHPANSRRPELKLRGHGIGSIDRVLGC